MEKRRRRLSPMAAERRLQGAFSAVMGDHRAAGVLEQAPQAAWGLSAAAIKSQHGFVQRLLHRLGEEMTPPNILDLHHPKIRVDPPCAFGVSVQRRLVRTRVRLHPDPLSIRAGRLGVKPRLTRPTVNQLDQDRAGPIIPNFFATVAKAPASSTRRIKAETQMSVESNKSQTSLTDPQRAAAMTARPTA
jgi:hypothetical protein